MFDLHNAAAELLDRNVSARANKIAFIDDNGQCTYAELARSVDRFAGWLSAFGVNLEGRILLCLNDGIDFVTACLGAIKAGVVPVMANPLLKTDDLEYLLADSRAQVLVVSSSAWPSFAPIVDRMPFLRKVIVSGGDIPQGCIGFADALSTSEPIRATAPTRGDEPCIWQYSSGSTGRPKGTIHVHSAITQLESLFPKHVLKLTDSDVTFSAAKLFFGYGFGNGLVFPLSVGATSILMSERPTAESVSSRLRKHQPTVFYGVPTLYNMILASGHLRGADVALRACVSSGEALPPDIGIRWRQEFGIGILEGMGSTEMLHIFVCNRADDIQYGTTGTPVEGYELKLLDEDGARVSAGEIGELHVKGPTMAAGYWCSREKAQRTFVGGWVRSGDKFYQDQAGRYIYCGRADDMIKVGGIFVSPFEVESALRKHPDVADAAVVGWPDLATLIKPKAFVVLKTGIVPSEDMAEILKAHMKKS